MPSYLILELMQVLLLFITNIYISLGQVLMLLVQQSTDSAHEHLHLNGFFDFTAVKYQVSFRAKTSYPGGGGDSHMKQTGMLVVSLRGVNFGFWSRLGCFGQSANIFCRQGLV